MISTRIIWFRCFTKDLKQEKLILKTITRELLQPFIDFTDSTVATIYMPANKIPTPDTVKEDMIRFKNLLKQAQAQLEEAGVATDKIKHMMAHAEEKVNDQDFWRHSGNGLVIFMSDKESAFLELPFESEEHVCIGSKFDVAPALAACSFDQKYMVLALAVHNPKLYMGDMNGLTEVQGIDLPKSPEDALNIDEMFINSNTVRGVATSGGGNGRYASHGQGDSHEAGNEERLSYFRIIDNMMMHSKMVNNNLPLILTGIDSEVAEFKSISNYPNILDAFLHGNHVATKSQQLHELVWPLVSGEILTMKRNELMNRYHELMGAEKSSSDLKVIEEAASMGRVDTLLIGIITSTRDSITDTPLKIMKMIHPDSMHATKLHDVIVKVLAQGGSIIGFDKAMLPSKSQTAALFRY